MSKETGGPAFPEHMIFDSAGDAHAGDPGMTLRDYYMAHAPITVEDAMQAAGYKAGSGSVARLATEDREDVFRFLALLRGEYADAMIDARVAP